MVSSNPAAAMIGVPALLLLVATATASNVPYSWKHLLDSSVESVPPIDWFARPFKHPMKASSARRVNLPVSFDARAQWPSCTSIGAVYNQGSLCLLGTHAIAATSVISDRTCIASNGANTKIYSSAEPLLCCPTCVLNQNFGSLGQVFGYWVNTGIVSGGAYGSNQGCLPYTFLTTCLSLLCPLTCRPGFQGTIASDRTQGSSAYTVPASVIDIQEEIYVNGPVASSFDLYTDFATYNGANVYVHLTGVYEGKASVKLLGWGTENGTDYWLGTAAYGTAWGNAGTFRFLRGTNQLGIEANVVAGSP